MTNKINNKKRDELFRSIEFLEELIWLFDSSNIAKIKNSPQHLRELLLMGNELNNSFDTEILGGEYKSPNPNIHFLIGVLPRLFKDEDLFPTNNSIIDFAEEFLNLNLPKSGKRSRNEIIGMIVCETDNLSDNKLKRLVTALSKIVSNEEQLKKIKVDRSNNNFSWNETIQKLTERRQ
ncbi:hypothetical protein [Paenibacillus ihumii]|uniref:hypothetical protein n=1 Tax=Paenibacillus ihumii TaxID=687436 RepID=UPI0006D7C3AE|nr:hypothetical protein [Paenibacillus ihumii]